MKFWGCWRSTPRGLDIIPCGDSARNDSRCNKCANNPRTLEDWEREREQHEIQLRVQRSWAKRWSL